MVNYPRPALDKNMLETQNAYRELIRVFVPHNRMRITLNHYLNGQMSKSQQVILVNRKNFLDIKLLHQFLTISDNITMQDIHKIEINPSISDYMFVMLDNHHQYLKLGARNINVSDRWVMHLEHDDVETDLNQLIIKNKLINSLITYCTIDYMQNNHLIYKYHNYFYNQLKDFVKYPDDILKDFYDELLEKRQLKLSKNEMDHLLSNYFTMREKVAKNRINHFNTV